MGRNVARIRGWQTIRRRILDRDGWRCQVCGLAGRMEVDHVSRLADGGHPTDPANLQAICRVCHIQKTRAENGPAASPAAVEWRYLLQSMID